LFHKKIIHRYPNIDDKCWFVITDYVLQTLIGSEWFRYDSCSSELPGVIMVITLFITHELSLIDYSLSIILYAFRKQIMTLTFVICVNKLYCWLMTIEFFQIFPLLK